MRGRELVGRKGRRRVADHALVFGQLVLDQEGIVPDEGGCRCGLRFDIHGENPELSAGRPMRPALSSAPCTTSQKPFPNALYPSSRKCARIRKRDANHFCRNPRRRSGPAADGCAEINACRTKVAVKTSIATTGLGKSMSQQPPIVGAERLIFLIKSAYWVALLIIAAMAMASYMLLQQMMGEQQQRPVAAFAGQHAKGAVAACRIPGQRRR